DKVVDNSPKVLLQIERVERNPEFIRHAPRILGICRRATALLVMEQRARSREHGELTARSLLPALLAAGDSRRRLAMAHKYTDHLVARFGQQVGRDARIDSTTHCQNDARHTVESRAAQCQRQVWPRRTCRTPL